MTLGSDLRSCLFLPCCGLCCLFACPACHAFPCPFLWFGFGSFLGGDPHLIHGVLVGTVHHSLRKGVFLTHGRGQVTQQTPRCWSHSLGKGEAPPASHPNQWSPWDEYMEGSGSFCTRAALQRCVPGASSSPLVSQVLVSFGNEEKPKRGE